MIHSFRSFEIRHWFRPTRLKLFAFAWIVATFGAVITIAQLSHRWNIAEQHAARVVTGMTHEQVDEVMGGPGILLCFTSGGAFENQNFYFNWSFGDGSVSIRFHGFRVGDVEVWRHNRIAEFLKSVADQLGFEVEFFRIYEKLSQ